MSDKQRRGLLFICIALVAWVALVCTCRGQTFTQVGSTPASPSQVQTVVNNFAARTGIVDPLVKNDLLGFASTLINAGINVVNGDQTQTNLVDAIFFHPRFKGAAGSNGVTWVGSTVTWSNVTQGNWGASFSGNGLISCPVADSRTNTFVVTWRGLASQFNNPSQQWLAGLVNSSPANDSAQWLYMPNDQLKFTFRETNTFYSSLNAETVIQPYYLGGFDLNEIKEHMNQRHMTATTCSGIGGGGIYSFFNNGVTAKYGSSTPSQLFTNTAIVPNHPLDTILLGVDTKGPAGGYFGGYFKGEIGCVLVFNRPLTTNQMAEVWRAQRWLEPETVNRVFLGDSRWAFPPFTNCPPQYFQDSGQHTNEVCWINLAQSGARLAGFSSAAISNIVFNMWAPTGKVTRTELYLQGGINDLYGDGSSFNTVSNSLFTLISYANIAGEKPYFCLISPLWTNSNVGFTYSAATEASLDALNEMCITNSRAFAGLIRQDQVMGQSELDTNLNTISFDGLHANYLNGPTLNRRIAELMLGNVQPYQQPGCVVYVMSAYTAKVSDATIWASTGSSYSVKLPAIPYHGLTIWIGKSSSDANTLTVDGNGRNVKGAATVTTTTQWAGFRCQYDATKNIWNVI